MWVSWTCLKRKVSRNLRKCFLCMRSDNGIRIIRKLDILLKGIVFMWGYLRTLRKFWVGTAVLLKGTTGWWSARWIYWSTRKNLRLFLSFLKTEIIIIKCRVICTVDLWSGGWRYWSASSWSENLHTFFNLLEFE